MISEDSLEKIAHIFCGDIEGYYSYKSGPVLVKFFNQEFHSNDKYGQGFPSRWIYVYNKIVELLNSGNFNLFLNRILSRDYLISEQNLSEVSAAEKQESILSELNKIIKHDHCKITTLQGKYSLIQEKDYLIPIGSGGFANVYLDQSAQVVIKKLKDDFLTDVAIRSRFKREFDITKSLKGLFGILNVYQFNPEDCSYSMELAEKTLEEYILQNEITENAKLNCIHQLLYIMDSVHKRDIIHRDLSPTNIFLISGVFKIADFGLGKDLNVFTSHQTINTNSLGQYFYCAPEQFLLLKEADKRSDVYSLGRIINFILTKDPRDSNHILKSVAEKALNTEKAYRFSDAGQMLSFFLKAKKYIDQEKLKSKALIKIENRQFDEEVEMYIYSLSEFSISKELLSLGIVFQESLIKFMHCSNNHAHHIIQSVDHTFKDVAGKEYEKYDIYADFAKSILLDEFNFQVKEIAANILNYIAWNKFRYHAQDLITELISETNLDPLLMDILNSRKEQPYN